MQLCKSKALLGAHFRYIFAGEAQRQQILQFPSVKVVKLEFSWSLVTIVFTE